VAAGGKVAGSLSTKLPWDLANPKWAASLNPLLANTLIQGSQIDGIILTAGVAKAINHNLGQLPNGWFVVDNVANSNIWRTQAFTTTVLTLQASANTTISIWVY